MQPQVGDLVRWIADWQSFRASEDGSVEGYEPLYYYGIITESTSGGAVTVYFYDAEHKQWRSLHMIHDRFEIVSKKI